MHHKVFVAHVIRHQISHRQHASTRNLGCLVMLGLGLMLFGGVIFFALLFNL